jgi:YggT family protein
MQQVFQFISTIISIYMIILLVRIVMSWFGGMQYGRVMDFLSRITDPYLNAFRGMRFLRIGQVDFSPVVAIIALSVLSNIFLTLGYAGTITLGLILALIVDQLASAAGFFLVIFLILIAVRLIALFANVDATGRFWMFLDHLLEPASARLADKVTRTPMSYRNGLFLLGGTILATVIVGSFVMDYVVLGLRSLPV